MSKIGKKYTLSSEQSLQTNELFNLLKQAKSDNLQITNITETYNSEQNLYEGTITVNGFLPDLRSFNGKLDRLRIKNSRKLDVVFGIDTHYEELLELPNSNNGVAQSDLNVYKFSSALEYNFLVRNYENFLNINNTVQETALPYFYDVLSEFVKTENYKGFEGTEFFETPNKIITEKFNQKLVTNVIPSQVSVDDSILSIDKYLEKFNQYKEQFPFYADVKFDTHELDVKSLIGAIQEKNLFTELLETIVNNASSSLMNFTPTFNNKNKINVKEFDVGNFLNDKLNLFANGDFTFIFDINQRIDSKSRTFSEVLEGKEEYSEVIGYHLKKYEEDTNTLIQEWYLPNTGEAQIKWVDSQIKYGKRYTYKLDLVILTFATQYEITDYKIQNGALLINFINTPLVKAYVLENLEGTSNITLGAKYTNTLLDYPPLEPEVELIPFIGADKQIKLSFNTSTGLKTVSSIEFSETEKANNDKLRLAQNKDPNTTLLTYQTDEPSDFIEIYRSDVKPKSYEEFFGKLLSVLSTNNSAGAAYLDNVLPNKKYYYTARSIDFHGNISNPTPIYELEIINDNGLVIPVINVVDFDKSQNLKQLTKQFKRYLKLQPAIRHRLPNSEKTSQSDIQLGSEETVPWNKTFKLRLTSKSTGKKIDINFKFKYNKPE